MTLPQFPSQLRWRQVDPRRHPFDPEEAWALLWGVLGKVRERGWDPTDEVTARLAERFGPWVSGWRWARDEGDFGGGPVSSWCCPPHSYWREHERTLEPTGRRILAALGEWRAWIETLAARFDVLAPAAVEDLPVAFELAAGVLIADVAEQTGAGDAWHIHALQVLTWYLERHGFDEEVAVLVVDEVLSGRFESWIGPDPALVQEVCPKLREKVADWRGSGK
jgi:hypothetical protein